jgi:hypothetical protein
VRSNFRFIGCLRLVLINVTIIVVTWEPKCFSCLRCNCGKKGYHLLKVHQCHVILCHIERSQTIAHGEEVGRDLKHLLSLG